MKLLPALTSAVAALSLLSSCGSDGHSGFAGAGDDTPPPSPSSDASTAMPPPSQDPCATPQEGCSCEEEGKVIDCGRIYRTSGGYTWCSMGKRTCTDALWGACVGDQISSKISTARTGSHLLSLGTAIKCADNPCDPYCVNYLDDGAGVDGGAALDNPDGGLALHYKEVDPTTTNCTGMTISPTPQTITVTSITPLVTSPNSLQYNVELTPPGCANTTIPATWQVSDSDICAITAGGRFDVYAGVAAPVSLTAYVATWQASAKANILVDVKDTSRAPAGATSAFAGLGTVADNATFLYPYDKTVFPRALAAPVVQWDNGGTAASAVKVTLRYPASGTTTFRWSTIIPESSPPRATIPQDVWTAFDQTAKGQDAGIELQRVVGGVLRLSVKRTVHFSTTPLRGLIYYTEYSRGPSNPAPSPAVGGTCSNPTLGAVIRSLDPTGSSPPVNPFETIAPGKCPVCHSVSANGRMFVTSDRGWGPGGGVSRINQDGTFTLISDSPQPPKPGEDSRGFAFAAVTPDGSYVLQGSNLWGNTKQNGQAAGSGYRMSAGNGQGLQGDYYATQDLSGSPALSQVDPMIDVNWAAGSPDPSIPTDHFSMRWTGKVQPYSTETYTFEAETEDGVRVWVNGTKIIDSWIDRADTKSTGTIALTAGTKYDIKIESYSNVGNKQVHLRWSSPTTAKEIIPETQLYPPPQPPSTNGLTGVYYDNMDFTGPTITRVDKTVNFDWGDGSPDPSMGADTFSVRWTGYIKPAYSETYTFQTATDDGVRLWVNGVKLVDSWVNQGTNAVCPADSSHSGTIALTAGVKVPVTMEYYENGGGAAAKLYWSSNSTACAPIPQSRLFQ